MSILRKNVAYQTTLTDRFTELPTSTHPNLHDREFEHEPLGDPGSELRYLYLFPKRYNTERDGQKVVRCELTASAPEHAPSYAALSYTWGDPQIRRPVAVGAEIFHATENLAVALEHLQEEEKTLVLWVDAICIDQRNTNEKNIQVQRMGNIYASASMVIVWLGVSADNSDILLEKAEASGHIADLVTTTIRSEFNKTIEQVLPIDALKAFLDRSWFKRVWVGQEASLNKEVIMLCGSHGIRRNELIEIYALFSQSRSFTGGIWQGPRIFRLMHLERVDFRDFVDEGTITPMKLALFGRLESSDPRDFVYSLFGSFCDLKKYGLRVDYSLSAEEVYVEFAKAFIRVRRLESLSSLWCRSSKYRNLPSWVPDWSGAVPWYICTSMTECGPSTAEVCVTEGGCKALKLKARLISRVELVQCELPEIEPEITDIGVSATQWLSQEEESQILFFLDSIQQTMSPDSKDCDMQKAEKLAYRTSIGFSMAGVFLKEDTPAGTVVYDSYRAFRGLKNAPEGTFDVQNWRREASRRYLGVLRTCLLKQIFTTSTGHVGLSRERVETGQGVYRFRDSRRGCVLREVEDGVYRIVSLVEVVSWDTEYHELDASEEELTII